MYLYWDTTDTVFIIDPTGIILLKEEVNSIVSFYPNPSSDLFHFEISSMDIGPFSLFIYDALGRTVKKLDKITSDRFTINRNGMENGIYLFELRTDEKVIGRGKLMLK